MPQIFRRSANTLAKLSLAGLLILVGSLIFAAILVARSSYVTRAHEYVEQPVQFSHRHHVKDDGIDCRYCHTSVETSSFAGIPPTKTCMNCHSQIWAQAPILEPIRASFREDRPLDRKSTRLNSSHSQISYAVFCLKKKIRIRKS